MNSWQPLATAPRILNDAKLERQPQPVPATRTKPRRATLTMRINLDSQDHAEKLAESLQQFLANPYMAWTSGRIASYMEQFNAQVDSFQISRRGAR